MANSHKRVIAVGDLNGAVEPLVAILRGTGVIDQNYHWQASNTHLIQLGDIFNRGATARYAFELLADLREQATRFNSEVTTLVGNHEVMTALGHEAYCTSDEYLAFATAKQQQNWPAIKRRKMRALINDHPVNGPISPVEPRLEAWAIRHVPGRAAFRRAVGLAGEIGKQIREMPVATIANGCVFSHSVITPRWARHGVAGLAEKAKESWAKEPMFYPELDRHSVLAARHGPLWNRQLVGKETKRTREQLTRSLEIFGVDRMVVGHNRTEFIDGGRMGEIAMLHDGRLACIDVGLGCHPTWPLTALVIDELGGQEWTPTGCRSLWPPS